MMSDILGRGINAQACQLLPTRSMPLATATCFKKKHCRSTRILRFAVCQGMQWGLREVIQISSDMRQHFESERCREVWLSVVRRHAMEILPNASTKKLATQVFGEDRERVIETCLPPTRSMPVTLATCFRKGSATP